MNLLQFSRCLINRAYTLGATSIDKIGEVRLSDEIGGEGFETLKKPNFIITIRYEIPTFSSVGPFFEEGGRGSRKFRPEAEILGIFSIEVTPYMFECSSLVLGWPKDCVPLYCICRVFH